MQIFGEKYGRSGKQVKNNCLTKQGLHRINNNVQKIFVAEHCKKIHRFNEKEILKGKKKKKKDLHCDDL